MIYPMKFNPVFKETIWGGKKLGLLLNKDTPGSADVGESWEVADHPNGTSTAANGGLNGRSFHEIFQAFRDDILGPRLAARFTDRFPLLVKFIDARDRLSLQVHPDDAYAKIHENGSFGKTEAWYVTHAEPGAFLIAGLKKRSSREEFEKALAEGVLEELMNKVPVKPGDFLFIPAGRIHAIMPGILLNEIQQNSDITYRVYDWGRTDKNGKSRELHVRQSLETINFNDSGVRALPSDQAEKLDDQRRLLTRNPFFSTEKWVFDRIDSSTQEGARQGFHILSVLSGQGTLCWKDGQVDVKTGDSLVVPWSTGTYSVVSLDGTMTVLNSYI